MSESSPYADEIAASNLLSHLYLTPVLVELVRGGVPDHLNHGPLHASDLAKRAGLNELSLTRALRALAASGAFQEVIEMLTVPYEPNPRVSIVDMMMLLYFGEARQRTVDEYSELFRATGLELTRVLPTACAFSIVEARPV